MKFAASLLFLVLVSLSTSRMLFNVKHMLTASTLPLSNCAGDGLPYTNVQFDDSVTLDSPPVKGKTTTIHLSGTALADMAFDHVDVITTLGSSGTQLDSRTEKYGKIVAAGDQFTWTFGDYIPGIIPTGTYHINFHFRDASGTEFECAWVPVTF